MEFAARIRRIAHLEPHMPAVEFKGSVYSWADMARLGDGIEALLDKAGIGKGVPVGWMAHNDPRMVGAAIGLLQSDRYLAPLNPHQPVARLTEEIERLAMAALIALPDDWEKPQLPAVARKTGATAICLDSDGSHFVEGLEKPGLGPHREAMPGYVMERMSSGTTGMPKRIYLTRAALEEGILAGPPSREDAEAAKAGELRLSRVPAIMYNPFAHAGGLFGLAGSLYFGRTIALHEKFQPEEWAASVRRHKAKVANLVPAMIRMILDAQVSKEDVASLIAVRSGTAPLDPETQAEFESRYGIPILIDYGASEFIGGVTGWSLRDHRQFAETKRGSVGRAKSGVELRITDEEGDALPHGKIGILEIRSLRWGPDWIRTTDLASLDEDGFLYIRGRADGVIIRGGFKIIPETVSEIIQRHPAVNEAVVVGVKDPRLGAVPLAVIEPHPDATTPATKELDALVRAHLPAYQAPAFYEFVPELPRTVSLKIARPQVRELLRGKYDFTAG